MIINHSLVKKTSGYFFSFNLKQFIKDFLENFTVSIHIKRQNQLILLHEQKEHGEYIVDKWWVSVATLPSFSRRKLLLKFQNRLWTIGRKDLQSFYSHHFCSPHPSSRIFVTRTKLSKIAKGKYFEWVILTRERCDLRVTLKYFSLFCIRKSWNKPVKLCWLT